MNVETVEQDLEKQAVSRSAFKVVLGSIFSLPAGFINQMIIAAFFGAGAEMDAYLTALVVPAYLQWVLLGGLSFVFIPAFVREEARGNDEAAWELVGTFFWITTGVLIVIAIIGIFFSKNIISLIAPGFSPEQSMLAARMFSVIMFSVPFYGLSDFTRGIQNARNSFFWPSMGGAINSIGNILAVVFLTRLIGPMALPWGFFVAIFLQSCVTVFPVLRHGWPRLIPLTDNRVIEMGKLMLPFILIGLFTGGTPVFERYFASTLSSGQLSYLGYAEKISRIYVTLLASGIASAIYPVMARAYTQRGKEGLGDKTIFGMRLTLAVGLPAVLITGAVSIPLVRVLFERGEFHSIDTLYVARIVLVSMLSFVFCHMLINIIIRPFFVLKDSLTPNLIEIVGVVTYIGIGRFFTNQWGYVGLAYARLVKQVIFIAILWISLTYKLSGIGFARILRSAFTYSLAALGAFYVGKLLLPALAILPDLLKLFISASLSGVFYLVILYFRDREILMSILELFGIPRILDLGKKIKSKLLLSKFKKPARS
jgi:putative peptidoglycan lipid II flippase